MWPRQAGIAAVLVLGGAAGSLAAQSLPDRVASGADGWVTFRVEVNEGVEICDEGVRIRHEDDKTTGFWMGRGADPETCTPGPMQIELERRSGEIRELRVRRVRVLDGARDLGFADPDQASSFLVSLAYLGASSKAAETGFALARLPRGADPGPGLLRASRDRELPAGIRKSALFWTGQLAADRIVGPLRDTARDDPEQGVREAAVFALSQQPDPRASLALMELATDAPHKGTRRAALFWLAQRDDPAVVEFLADLILGRSGG